MSESTRFAPPDFTEVLNRLPFISGDLSLDEQNELVECETIIDAGLQTFVEVGQALMLIRDQRLYRGKHETFDGYCHDRWRVSSSRARQLIRASQVVSNIESVTTVTLDNESQARALAPHTQEIQKAVMQIAVRTAPVDDAGKPMLTASHIKSVAKVLTELIEAGAMDDGSGVMKPLGTLVDANVTEETYERLMRQKEHIRQAQAKKTLKEQTEGRQPKLVGYALQLVTDLVKGIEAWAAAEEEMHPAVTDVYSRAKRSIEEALAELKKRDVRQI